MGETKHICAEDKNPIELVKMMREGRDNCGTQAKEAGVQRPGGKVGLWWKQGHLMY